MGQKINPISNRLGYIRGWDSNWYGGRKYGDKLLEDSRLRRYLSVRLAKASVSRIVIERALKHVTITICTARPGIVIGKGGQDVDTLKEELKKITNKDVQINIFEVRRPDIDAAIVADNIARQLEGKIAYRRAVKGAIGAAMRGGAEVVHSVDSSAKAIELTNKNIELNFPNDSRHEAICEDAFKYLDDNDGKYDLIILDPPAFAKHRSALKNGLRGYTRLNVKGFEKIKPGGILFTFSCSQVVTKDNFRQAVFTAAAQAGRKVRILHQLHQPADHPINIYHPEGEYLKGLVLYVE